MHRATTGWRRVGAAVLLSVLAACQTEPGVAGPGPRVMAAEERAACRRDAGKVVQGRAGEVCAIPQPDAGRSCRQNSDCAGFCLAPTATASHGTCSPLRPFFGCHAVFPAPGQVATLCVD